MKHLVLFQIPDDDFFSTILKATLLKIAHERGCSTVILANKWDLVAKAGPERAKEVRESILRGLRFLADAPLCQVSAKTGTGVGRLLDRSVPG